MSRKRSGGNRQLRPWEVEAQDEAAPTEAGTFKKADEAQLRKRRIVKVRRPKGSSKSSAASNGSGNIFSGGGFSLTGSSVKKSSTETPAGSSSISSLSLPLSKKDKALQKMKSLNKCFHTWVSSQIEKSPFSDYTCFLKEYIAYAEKIMPDVVLNDSTITGNSISYGGNFPIKSSEVSATSSLSFDAFASAPTEESKIKNESKEAESQKSLGKTLEKPKATEDNETNENNGTKNGTKNADISKDDEEKKHFVKAKVFSLKKGAWESNGIGEFRVMYNTKTEKARVVMYNGAGRLMLNYALYKTMKVKRDGKKDVVFMAITADGPVNTRIRVKDPTDADFLKDAMEKYIPTS